MPKDKVPAFFQGVDNVGSELIEAYKKTRTEYKTAFYYTFIISLLIHFYKFTNTLPNRDSVLNFYSDQNMLRSGRWALSPACGISSYYDLPWVNGIISCLFIALTAVIIIKIFRITNPVLIVLTGGLLAASPATSETFFYLFTADGYMIAMFLAALAVCLTTIEKKKKRYTIAGILCVCVSCGIYQAYVSFSLLLTICCLIDYLLCNGYQKQEYYRWILRQVVVYVAALICYYLIWKACMFFTGTAATSYMGISSVGKIDLRLMADSLKSAVRTVLLYFVQWNFFKSGITLYAFLDTLLFLALGVETICVCIKTGLFKRKWSVILLALCVLAIIPAACMWKFTVSENMDYRPMMLQGLTVLFILTGVIFEKWGRSISRNAIGILLALIIFNNALMANISYFYLNLCNERTYAEGLEMTMEIHDMEDEYSFNTIAFVGNRLEEVMQQNIKSNSNPPIISDRNHILNGLLTTTLLYDPEHTMKYIKEIFGVHYKTLNKESRNAYLEMEEVKEMGCWPEAGSLKVIEDTLIIKLSDEKE